MKNDQNDKNPSRNRPASIEIVPFGQAVHDSLPRVLALGAFDGLHRGHLTLLRQTVARAAAIGGIAGVFTFRDPTYKGAPRLTENDTRKEIFSSLGIREICVADFDDVRSLSPADFLGVLCDTHPLREVVCGPNFRFGRGGAGTTEDLRALLSPEIRVTVIPYVTDRGTVVSSTAVRLALENGDPERAIDLLGAPYLLCGDEKKGKGLGRTLGFPTINFDLDPDAFCPKFGVYVTGFRSNHGYLPAVSNIGVRPTTDVEGSPNCETHLLSFPSDFSHGRCEVALLHFLREERRFADPTALTAQMEIDREEAKKWVRDHRDLFPADLP